MGHRPPINMNDLGPVPIIGKQNQDTIDIEPVPRGMIFKVIIDGDPFYAEAVGGQGDQMVLPDAYAIITKQADGIAADVLTRFRMLTVHRKSFLIFSTMPPPWWETRKEKAVYPK